MKGLNVKPFRKNRACPSSSLLLSFQHQALAPEITFLIRQHLFACDFCFCEIPLLAFYTRPLPGECHTPELPINLRLLAEAILGQNGSAVVVSDPAADGKDSFSLMSSVDANRNYSHK